MPEHRTARVQRCHLWLKKIQSRCLKPENISWADEKMFKVIGAKRGDRSENEVKRSRVSLLTDFAKVGSDLMGRCMGE